MEGEEGDEGATKHQVRNKSRNTKGEQRTTAKEGDTFPRQLLQKQDVYIEKSEFDDEISGECRATDAEHKSRVATKGTTNRRSYLESRRNSSAGKHPGANIDSLALVILFPMARGHEEREKARQRERRKEKRRRNKKRREERRRDETRPLPPCSLSFIPVPWSVSASVLCNFPSQRFGEYLRRDLEALINPARASTSDRRWALLVYIF